MRRSLLLAVLLAATACAQTRYQPMWESVDKRPTPDWFGDAKFGIFIHWGVYSVPAFAPVKTPKQTPYAEWYWNSLTKGQQEETGGGPGNATSQFHKRVYGANFAYPQFAAQFKAELYDPEHWADVFARSGARYVVLTSKHHDGFALWPSAEATKTWGRPWNAVDTGPKRDLAGDLTSAVRRHGLKMGFYYSLYEWYNPIWLKDHKRFVDEHMWPQFKDLVTRYRPSIIFSDGEWDMPSADWRSAELLAWLFNESPVRQEVVVNDRWGKETRHKHGGYWTTEYTPGLDAGAQAWEESRGMGHSYGYNRMERVADYRTARELVLMLVDLVSRGGNLLLDIGPTGDGRIPVIMEDRLIEMGRWLRVNGEAIYGTRPWRRTRQWSAGRQPGVETGKQYMTRYEVTDVVDGAGPGLARVEAFFTAKGDTVYAIVPRWPPKDFLLRETASARSVSLLGSKEPLKWERASDGIRIRVPDFPAGKEPCCHATVLKVTGVQ